MKIIIKELEKLVFTALEKKYSKEYSKFIAEVVLFGELSTKKSHGIVRLISGGSSCLAQKPKGKLKIKKITKFSEIIDANGNPNMLAASFATQDAIKIAKKSGFAIVGTKGTFSTSGCLTYYIEKIAKENLIGIIMARSPLCMPPYGGIEPLFGTNPIAWGIPATPQPFLFDMGTTAISYGAVLKARATKQKLPQNVAIDSTGNPTTDPQMALNGSLLAFDNSYKGSGLALIVEILAGTLTGAGFGGIHEKGGWGNIFIVFSPKLLTNVEEFKNKMKKFVNKVKNSKTNDGSKVRIAGEKTIKTRDDNLKKGWIEVADELINAIKNYINTGELI